MERRQKAADGSSKTVLDTCIIPPLTFKLLSALALLVTVLWVPAASFLITMFIRQRVACSHTHAHIMMFARECELTNYEKKTLALGSGCGLRPRQTQAAGVQVVLFGGTVVKFATKMCQPLLIRRGKFGAQDAGHAADILLLAFYGMGFLRCLAHSLRPDRPGCSSPDDPAGKMKFSVVDVATPTSAG